MSLLSRHFLKGLLQFALLAAAAASIAFSQGLSEADVLQMYRSGTSETEITKRIQQDGITFEMDSGAVLRLGEAGVPRDMLDAMLNARVNVGGNADELIRAGKLDMAIRVLGDALLRNPRQHQARFRLILLLMKENRTVDAAAQFKVLKSMDDDQQAREIVKQIEDLLPETGADPDKELGLRKQLNTALDQLRTKEAYSIVDRMQIGKRSREVIKTYLDIGQANFPGAFLRAAQISSEGDAESRRVASELRVTVERSFRQYQEVSAALDRFLYSQLAVGSCTPTTARTGVGQANFSLQDYVQRVIDANHMFPLDPRMQDLRFHAVLLSSPRFEDVLRVGEQTLAAKGTLRVPFFSRDELFWLVLDGQKGRIYTESNRRMPRNNFGSADLSQIEPFNLSFPEVKAVRQRVVADHALYGIARDSYALALSPRGKAPNYTFMNLIHCLYGEQVQKTVTRNLGEMVVRVIGNPGLEAVLADPEKKSRDWIMTGAKELAVGSMAIAVAMPIEIMVHPGKLPDGTTPNTSTRAQTTMDTVNMSVSMMQESLNVLAAHALELIRASEILGNSRENVSMFGMLQNRAYPLIDPALPQQQIARVDNLLSMSVANR